MVAERDIPTVAKALNQILRFSKSPKEVTSLMKPVKDASL
jgi:hypothetical protein